MQPLAALGRFGLQGGELGFNEPRHLDMLWHSGNSQTPAAPQGQSRAFYLLPEHSEQSGDVTALTTTIAINVPSADFSRSGFQPPNTVILRNSQSH
jgi:hypothetical protein